MPWVGRHLKGHLDQLSCNEQGPLQLRQGALSSLTCSEHPDLAVGVPHPYACLTTGTRDGAEQSCSNEGNEHAEELEGGMKHYLHSHPSLTTSHSHPNPSTLLTCFLWKSCLSHQGTTLPTDVQRTKNPWDYTCLSEVPPQLWADFQRRGINPK